VTEAQKLAGLITSPRKTFAEIKADPSWVVPFVLIVLITYVLNFIVYQVLVTNANFDQVARAKVVWDAAEKGIAATPGEIDKGTAVLRTQRSRWYLLPIFGVVVSALGISALFWAIFRLLRAGLTFQKVFSVVCWSFVIYRVIGGALTAVALCVRGPAQFNPAPPEAWSPTSFAHLLSRSSVSPNLYSAISKLDIFLIWFLVLLAIGFSSAARNLSLRTASIVVAACEMVYLMLNAVGALPGAS
jgi:hypothetical protein